MIFNNNLSFKGWKDQDGNIYNPGQQISITKNMSFTAQWTHHQWKLILDGNGGSVQGKENERLY